MTNETHAYLALVRKEPDSCFGVEFPAFPGCISAGDTLSEAIGNAAEALDLHIRGMIADSEPLPEPDFETAFEAPREDGVVIAAVIPRPPKGRAVRANITIDENLLRAADREATRIGTTRSGLIAEALRARLG